jgi:predicted dinucleotide-binding enzyme
MCIGVLGTGMVGRAIATKLADLGHEVKMGSRTAANESAAEWVASAGAGASQGTFADAAAHGELVFNCTAGEASLAALESAGAENLAGKVLVDVSNALDHSRGMPPGLFTSSFDSLGEQIQRAFPDTRVVKALNTVNCEVLCGDDEAANARVVELLQSFGWPAESVVDLGDLSSARGMEAYLLLWIRLWGALGTGHFNVKVVR